MTSQTTKRIETTDQTETFVDAFEAALRPSRVPTEVGPYEALTYAYNADHAWLNVGTNCDVGGVR